MKGSKDAGRLRSAGESGHRAMVVNAVAGVTVVAAIFWTYWDTTRSLWETWVSNPDYSHAFLVPLFSLYLLWHRRNLLPVGADGRWWGLVLLAGAGFMQIVASYWYYATLTPYSLLISLAGIAVLAAGWPALRWSLPSIGFLFFMFPLPGRCVGLFSSPLQRIATKVSTYFVQLIGIPAVSEGNVIVLTETKIGVVEACSGLRMLILFFALATGIALLIQRHWSIRILLVASAVPIAILSNVARIAVTAAMHEWVGEETAQLFFHDLAGWFMMPLALGLFWLELAIFDRVVVPDVDSESLLFSARAAP